MTGPATKPVARMLVLFAATSLCAILLGAVAMNGHDVPPSRWIPNLIGWTIGAALAFGLSIATADPGRLRLLVIAGTAGIIASLAGPDQSGVQRWIGLGPLTINAAALFLPVVIAAIARMHRNGPIVWGSVLVIAATLLAQPDASQSLAFAIAVILATGGRMDRRSGWLAAVLLCLTVATFLRPDPLKPVPEVEQIVSMAWQTAPLLAVAMVAALASAAASYTARSEHVWAARALAAYAALTMLAPLYGWFPVPLAGSGVSFVIGLWLGAGVLAMRIDQAAAAAD